MILAIVNLIFLLLALLVVLEAFWPGWNLRGSPSVTIGLLIGLLVKLVVLFILYLIVLAILRAFGASMGSSSVLGIGSLVSGGLLLGMAGTPPVFGAEQADAQPDTGGYAWRYVLNVLLVSLTVFSVLANYITTANITASWLGLTDVQWHWTLLVLGFTTALNAAFNRTPPLTKFPTSARLALEAQVNALRQNE